MITKKPAHADPHNNMSALPDAEHIAATLQPAQQWEQRYRYLLGLAKMAQQLHAVPEETAFAVAGCEAPVWLKIECQNNRCYYYTHSSSRLIAGLLVVLFAPVQGKPHSALSEFNFNQWLTSCGLQQQLTPSRSNGLYQIYSHAKQAITD